MVGLVPPSQELGRSRTALPPFPSRLPCLSLLPLYPYYIITGAICQVLYFAEKILDENLVVFRGSFPSPIDLAPSISTSKVCGVSFPYLIYIAGLALSDLIGLIRLSWVSLLA